MRLATFESRFTIGSLPATFKAWGRNARIHSPKQVRQLAPGIETLGFINPVIIDAENRILAGHGRVAAAQLLGLRRVPCLRVACPTTLTEALTRRGALWCGPLSRTLGGALSNHGGLPDGQISQHA